MWRLLTACAGLALLSACASVPKLPYESGVGVADVIHNVKCELSLAVRDNAPQHPWLKNWAAGIELTLDVIETGSAGVSAEVVVPLNSVTDGSLGASLQHFRRAESISSITFTTTLATIAEQPCVTIASDKRRLLRGELGLKAWLARAADAIDAAGITSQTNGVGYIIEFGVISSGGLDPTFRLLKLDAGGGLKVGVDGGGALSASRDDTHTLNIALAPIYPILPQQVYVTNFDELNLAPGTAPPAKAGKPAKASAVAPVRPAGVPQSTQQNLSDIIRSLKQSQNARD